MDDDKRKPACPRVTRATLRAPTPTDGGHSASREGSRAASPIIEAAVKRRSVAEAPDWTEPVESADADTELGTQVDGESSRTVKQTNHQGKPTHSPSLAPRVEFSIVSQNSRIAFIRQAHSRAQNFTPENITLIELESEAAQLDRIWELFHTQHEAFGLVCSTEFFEHSYMTEQVYDQGLLEYDAVHQLYAKIRSQLTASQETRSAQGSLSSLVGSAHQRNLPEITLPAFTGDYSSWPSFKDLFSSLIIEDSSLSKVAKMHYLKTCVKDSAAQLISTLPVAGDSFDSAWSILIARYENNRLLISTHLDKLFQIKPLPARSATALQALLTTIAEALNALQVLGSPIEHWDQLLVYLVTHKLDTTTREAWENKFGSSSEFPSFTQLKTFLVGRARVLERLEASPTEATTTQRNAKPPPRNAHNAVAAPRTTQETKSPAYPCDCCQGSHYIVTCSKFRDLEPTARRKLVEDTRLCFNCLGHHSARSCNSNKNCRTCGERHHTMIHPPSKAKEPTPSTSSTPASQALLITPFSTHLVRLLIDPGSELSFIADQQVKLINLKLRHSRIPINGIGGVTSSTTRGVTQVTLQSLHSNEVVSLNTHVLGTLTSVLPTFIPATEDWTHLHGLELADPDFLTPQPVDIIVGADSYGRIIKSGLKKLNDYSPIAQLTLFGWIVLGPVSSTHCSFTAVSHHASGDVTTKQLQELLTKFWTQQELISTKPVSLSIEEQECESHFSSTHQRDSSGRYIVRLPFKSSVSQLGDSYLTAQRILHRLLKRLSKDTQYRQQYTTFLEEYEHLDHMRPATHSPSEPHSYYLPHHGVLRPTSSTTKLRVVFNRSSSTSTGISLNDVLHTGPKIQRDLSDVLLWVRRHRYVFATDISKMFRQIRVHPDDWKYQRILWSNSAGEIVPYDLTTVTYGTRAAPFLAVRTLEQLIKDEGHRFPLAINPLSLGRYVDDIYGGSNRLDELTEIAHQVRGLCTAGGFPLAMWQSNHRKLLASISDDSPLTTSHSRLLDDSSTTILGLTWYHNSDTFRFEWKPPDTGSRLTKRIILSEIAQLYDPLGFLAPLIVRAKILLQELWLLKLNWDDSLPPTTHHQ